MSNEKAQDPRRVTAERNVEAILDATERLLESGRQTSISAVAVEAGVSRPTVYAHFPDRRRLLEALVERTVRQSTAALEAAEPERGPPLEALQRLIETSWEVLGRHEAMAAASHAELSAEAMRRSHAAGRRPILGLIERGRRDGVFRTDLESNWLVTSALALIHAAAAEVRIGGIKRDAALEMLSATVTDLFVGSKAAK